MKNTIQKNIAILGSTGSIGTQALDIVSDFPELFRVNVLTARRNWQLLARQAMKFKPKKVVIADEQFYLPLKEALASTDVEVASGKESIAEVAGMSGLELVLTAMVGYSGLRPTISAINSGKELALANKETLVVAGEIITALAKEKGIRILPVDSEHSAIFQCLEGERHSSLKKIILTASGGPFRTFPKEMLEDVDVSDALNHPNWVMGSKVTIDSATMMNKGFEMIEAKWLFDCKPENIEILVHPQSIVHSMVEFIDGSIKAQIGKPDMHIPIQYALGYPRRLKNDKNLMDLAMMSSLSFEKPDFEKFPLLRMAYEAIKKGGNRPCVLNAANEIAVKAFLDKKIKFTQMHLPIEYAIEKTDYSKDITIEELEETNRIARKYAEEWIEHIDFNYFHVI